MSVEPHDAPHDSVPVSVVADAIEDGFGMVRTDESPPLIVAVLHDGTEAHVMDAETHAALLRAAPAMLALLKEALAAWADEFDGGPDDDLSVSGADLVDWFSQWRAGARDALRRHLPAHLL
jgi:hypothetical protein